MTIDNLLAKNKELKRIHAGRRCFLVGNGPSLNSQDVLLLRVIPQGRGAACHTGRRSCFYRRLEAGDLIIDSAPLLDPAKA